MATNTSLEQRTVAELMTRDLLTIAEDESVLMAWELMCQAEVHHLPVTDVEGGFLGVVDAQTLTAAWNATAPRDARRPVTTLLPHRRPAAIRPQATVPEAAFPVHISCGAEDIEIQPGASWESPLRDGKPAPAGG